MTDTTSAIDEANATILAAETQALESFNEKYTAFIADLQTIVESLGNGGPKTSASMFFTSVQAQLASNIAMQLQSVLSQYGLINATPNAAATPAS